MKLHSVRVHPSSDNLAKEDQLAWKIAGVAADNLGVQGFGPDRPVADNATAEGRARNRRIEFRVL